MRSREEGVLDSTKRNARCKECQCEFRLEDVNIECVRVTFVVDIEIGGGGHVDVVFVEDRDLVFWLEEITLADM